MVFWTSLQSPTGKALSSYSPPYFNSLHSFARKILNTPYGFHTNMVAVFVKRANVRALCHGRVLFLGSLRSMHQVLA